jgi:4-hydroxybenzoate polyprenyltransferase
MKGIDSPDLTATSFVFWSTLLIYQLNTRLRFSQSSIRKIKYLEALSVRRKVCLIIILLIIIFHLPFIGFKTTFYLAHLGLISALYNVPESQHVSILPLRSIPLLKIFLIAYVWASISSFLPQMVAGLPGLTYPTLLVFIAHFLFILSITLPFDIRDYHRDFEKSLITTPQVVGIAQTKVFAIAFLMAFMTLYLLISQNGYILMLTLPAAYLIVNSSYDKKDYYYTFFIDGTIILYYIIVKISVN